MILTIYFKVIKFCEESSFLDNQRPNKQITKLPNYVNVLEILKFPKNQGKSYCKLETKNLFKNL